MVVNEDQEDEIIEVPMEDAFPPEEPLEERPPQVVHISPPPGFDDPALAPFIELYMEKRGLTNRSQAAIKLANSMWTLGVDPQKEMSNVTDYLSNMNEILAEIPDTDETAPIKGALFGRTAMEASNRMRNVNLGEGGIEKDFENMLRVGAKMKMTMKMLDDAFGEEGSKMNPEVEELRRRLDARDEQDKFNTLLAPLKDQITGLTDLIEKLGDKPNSETPKEVTEITATLEAITNRLDTMDQRHQFDEKFGDLKDEFNKVTQEITALKAGGGAGGKEGLPEVLETLLTVRDKLATLSGEGPASEVDWRATAISVFGETVKEGITAVKEIRVAEEKGENNEKKGGTSTRVIDRLVTNYCKKEIQKGNFEMKPDDVATELNITPRQAFDSIMRLRDQGLFKTNIPETESDQIKREKDLELGQVVEP